MKITKEQKSALASYIRSSLATVLAIVLAGETSPKALGSAAIAAFLPPIVRWLNPGDAAFGRTK